MKDFKIKPPAVFLLLSLVFGTLYALVIPPFQSPDEPNHFLRAYQVSEGHFFPEKTDDQRLGGSLPTSLAQARDSFAYLKNDNGARTNSAAIRRMLSIPLTPGTRQFLDFANTAMYAPTAYLPQAAAIAIFRPLGATPLEMFYGARLLNLWVWCTLIFAALRILPGQQWTMAALALLPASLIMAASCNADIITNGLCFYLFSACLAGPAFNNRSGFALLPAFVIIAANKLIVSVFLLLQWLTGHRQRTVFIAFITLCIAFLWGTLAQRWFIPFDNYNPAFRDAQTLNEGVNPGAQLTFVMTHPFEFMATATASYWKALPSIAAHIMGKFGWEKNYLPGGWIVSLWFAVAALIFTENNPANRGQRRLSAGVALLYILLFSVTMYMLWNPVGSPVLSNLQGRYFVPIMPLVALVIGFGYLRRFQKQVVPIALIVLQLGQIMMFFSIWERYYR